MCIKVEAGVDVWKILKDQEILLKGQIKSGNSKKTGRHKVFINDKDHMSELQIKNRLVKEIFAVVK